MRSICLRIAEFMQLVFIYVILLDRKGNKLFLEKYFFTSFGDQLHHQKKWVANGWAGELYTGMTENNNMLLVESKSWCQI